MGQKIYIGFFLSKLTPADEGNVCIERGSVVNCIMDRRDSGGTEKGPENSNGFTPKERPEGRKTAGQNHWIALIG